MFELAADLLPELARGRAVAVVTVVAVDGSAPRALGSSMAVTEDGRAIGSISGGCVEADAYRLARETLADGRARRERFGFSDEDALRAGLSCGGRLGVLAYRLLPADADAIAQLRRAQAGEPAGAALVFDAEGGALRLPGPRHDGSGDPLLAELDRRIRAGSTGLASAPGADGARVLYLVRAAPARMIVFGAVDFSGALCDAAGLLGYRVTVCDPREVFATRERFPSAAEVVVAWPDEYLAGQELDERTVVCVLSHDERFDVPALQAALAQPFAYVGAMGSRRTHERRLRQLREAGVSEEALRRLHSPIGLDLGGATPEETAVAILAEIIACRHAASGMPLALLDGPIHRRAGRS